MDPLAIILIAVTLLTFWLSQMVALMNMKDDAFPGKHDKILWVAVVLIGSFLGALAFLLWRTMRSGEAVSDVLAHEIGGLIGKDQNKDRADESHRQPTDRTDT